MAHTIMNCSSVLLHKVRPTTGVGCYSYRHREATKYMMFACSSSNSTSVNNTKISPLQRKLIWFHHIKSSKKKKHILEWGKELNLGGYCKPGFPGVLIVEGKADNVSDYLKRIKRLRWQHLQVRGEEEELLSSEDQSVDSFRRFPVGIRELAESGMSELAAECRAVNLEELFLTAFNLSR